MIKSKLLKEAIFLDIIKTGNLIKELRSEKELTQKELAERIGADKGYISRVERGKTVPSVAMLYKIAAAMGLCVELRPI